MALKRSKDILTTRKQEIYTENSQIIQFWRRNPIIAAEDILGIRLMDSQKYVLQMSWNTPYALWMCSRNFGKSFLASIIIILKYILFENQNIFIVASAGSQSHECFMKIEDIAMQRIGSIKSLKDIFANETVKSPACQTGFSHNPTSFHVGSYNGSDIWTLNSNPDNNRSKRASLVFFDEAAFSEDELLTACIAFASQDSNFVTSIDDNFSIDSEKRKCPTQLLFASSSNDTECLFHKKFKDYSMKMFMGDRNYFVASIPCDIPLAPIMDGKPHPPLLKKNQIEDEMRINREKALREYYNIPTSDGGETQIIKSSMLIRNSTLLLPKLCNTNNQEKFIMAIDPARTTDNSCCGVMELKFDEKIGYYGEIGNLVNFIEAGKKKKIPMRTPDQVNYFKSLLLDYNGTLDDYVNIDKVLLDDGAGGAGLSGWADPLMEDWTGKDGRPHRGLIDPLHQYYKEYVSDYPNAIDKLQLITFKKYKNQMAEELVELLKLDLIKMPKEYDMKGFVNISENAEDGNKKELKINTRHLTIDEELALINIDAMKTEAKSIHRFNNDGNVTYKLPKDKERIMHDDRFAVLCMLAHRLYEIRREYQINQTRVDTNNDLLDYCYFL